MRNLTINRCSKRAMDDMPEKRNDEAGFTIIEMIVAVTLFLVVTSAIYGLLEVGRADRHTTNQRVEAMQNLRVALNAIGRDALNAGYRFRREGALMSDNSLFTVTGLPFTTTGADFLTPVVSGRNINANTLQVPAAAANTAQATDQVTFAYFDESFNNGDPVSLSAVSSNGDSVTIQTGVTNNVCRRYDVFLISNGPSAAIGVMTNNPNGSQTISLANTDPLNINLSQNDTGSGATLVRQNLVRNVMMDPAALNGATTPVRPTTLTRLVFVTYKVLSDGSLVRDLYGVNNATGMESSVLAYNIRDMAISYVLADGTTTTDPVAGPDNITGNADDTPVRLRDVRQVIVTLTARSAEPDRRNNQFFTTTISATFNTRNLGYANNPA